MTPRTRIVKIGTLLLPQFGLLELNVQRFWIVTAYEMMEVFGSARKAYLQRKIRYLQVCRVQGFPDSVVLLATV